MVLKFIIRILHRRSEKSDIIATVITDGKALTTKCGHQLPNKFFTITNQCSMNILHNQIFYIKTLYLIHLSTERNCTESCKGKWKDYG